MYSLRKISLTILMALTLFGCSAQGLRLIAEYPAGKQPDSVEPIWPPLPEFRLVYYAFLALEVSNLERAVSKAETLAYELGGYLVRSDAWDREGRKQVTLVFALPMPNFEEFRKSLFDLGRLQTERVWGEWVHSAPGALSNYAEVTVQLLARGIPWPGLPIDGWNPGRTFIRAIDVFLAIFGTLADVLIWIGVVLGPFALLAWLGWKLALRLRRRL